MIFENNWNHNWNIPIINRFRDIWLNIRLFKVFTSLDWFSRLLQECERAKSSFLYLHLITFYLSTCHCNCLLTFNLLSLISLAFFCMSPNFCYFNFLASCCISGGSYLQAKTFQPTSRMTVRHDSTCSM